MAPSLPNLVDWQPEPMASTGCHLPIPLLAVKGGKSLVKKIRQPPSFYFFDLSKDHRRERIACDQHHPIAIIMATAYLDHQPTLRMVASLSQANHFTRWMGGGGHHVGNRRSIFY